MKKIKLTLIVAMLAVITVASAQVRLGVKGGINISNFYGSELNDNNMKIGFNAGVSADVDITYNMAIQSGLFFTTKGSEFEAKYPVVGNVKASTTASYLQIPVHLAYKIDVTPGTKVFLHAGPYAAYGIAGNRKIDNKWVDGFEEIFGEPEVKTFDKDYGYKAFDAGLGIGAGVELGQLVFDLGWDMGLVNISQASGGSIKNQSAYLSVGFKF